MFCKRGKGTISGLAALLMLAFWVIGTTGAVAADKEEAEHLYQEAQKMLNSDKYEEAADLYMEAYLADNGGPLAVEALYWHAFSLYRSGGRSDLRAAASALELLLERHSREDIAEEAESLRYRIYGELAKRGDRAAAREMAKVAEELEEREARREREQVRERERDLEREYEEQVHQQEEIKVAALQALMNMNSERALPILKKILTDPESDDPELREHALFLLVQHDPDEAADVLMHLAQNDPDTEVRSMAVYWLGETESEEALVFLEDLVSRAEDKEVLEGAIYALSQRKDERSRRILMDLIRNPHASNEVKAQAVFMLGREGDEETLNFLVDLYGEADDHELKEAILHGVAQNADNDDERVSRWFMQIIMDDTEPVETRQTALFWAGQQGQLNLEELARLYDSMEDPEMREQVIYVLSQQGGSDAFDVLLDIASKESDSELRQQLIFWIGQSDDPRAEEFLLKILSE